MAISEEMIAAIEQALNELREVVEQYENMQPPPEFRPRRFYFVPGQAYCWPQISQYGVNYYRIEGQYNYSLRYSTHLASAADMIAVACGFQPSRVLHSVRRIQAAARWLAKRIEHVH